MRRSILALSSWLAACGGGGASAPAQRAPASPVSAAPSAARDSAAPVDAKPTVLTEEQRARDAALAPRAAAVVDAYPNVGSLFSSLVAEISGDGKRMLYGSLRDGLPEIYLADPGHPSDPPRALTSGPERAIWAHFTRDDKYVIFTRDHGADEQWRYFRAAPDGSGVTELTPGPDLHRDEPVLPRSKPDMLVYTTHEPRSAASKLVVQSISSGDPRVVYEDPAPANAVDATADGAHALLVRFHSASDFELVEVDTSNGKASRLYPPDGTKARIDAAAYAPDGAVAYVTTDEGREGSALLAIDRATKKTLARWAVDDPSTAAIRAIAVSPKGDRVAAHVDAGNHAEIRVLDLHTLHVERKVAMPLGQGGLGSFTSDGKGFTFWMSTAEKPADIFLADAATGESKPLRDDPRPGLAELSPLTVSIETTKAHDGLTIPINVYLPEAAAKGLKLPTLVVFHGGPSNSYAVRWSPFTRFFTAQGFVVVEPNVRGSTGFGRSYEMADNREKRADVLRDMETVNAWVKARPWCDPSRVAVFGGSYGGYVTLMALTRQPSLWRAGVDLFGVVNLKTFLRSTDQFIRTVFVDEFGDLDKDAALLDEFSPSRGFDQITAPLFVYAGANDPRVPLSEDDQLVMALRKRNVPVEYMVAPNEGHSIDHRDNKIELMTRVVRFLGDAMK